MDIQNQIEEALKQTENITTLDNSKLTNEQRLAFRMIDIYAHEWLIHQQSIIFQQAKEIVDIKRGVPTGEYMVLSDGVEVEIYKDPLLVIAELRAENKRLQSIEQALIDFQNNMLPSQIAQDVYNWLHSTTGYKGEET